MKKWKQAAAAVISAVMALQAMPLTGISAADGDLLVTDFEDGDVSAFSKRGDEDTSVIEATTEDAHSGKTCMSVSERSSGWNGPSVSLEAIGCKPGVQYIASAWVKMKWYNTARISMKFTDADGEQHYNNLSSVNSDNAWVEIPAVKFSFSEEMKDVSIYIEAGDSAPMWVDDFSLTAAPVYPIQKDIPSLKNVYADYFKIGCAVTASELAPQSTQDLILKHNNSITLGNELKPDALLSQSASKAYLEETGDNTVPQIKLSGNARTILNFARDHKIPVRGHVLVWYSQTPTWFFMEDYSDDYSDATKWCDKETMLKRMENYIKAVYATLAEEYPDVNFYAWDVVNEAYLDDGKPRQPGKYEDGNGSSAWVKVFGDNSFIEPAFTYARKYAPKGTKLYYNDYNEYATGKLDAVIKMATDLKEKGLIDGIGLQSHLDVRTGPDAYPSANVYASALDKYCATGLDIQVTELDVTIDKNHLDESGFKAQAEYYSAIMDAIASHKDQISAVVFWGTTDDQSWRASQLPLLFDEKYQAKPCFDAIIDGIKYTEPEETDPVPGTTTTAAPVETGLRGDTNEDGIADVVDAVLLARYLAEDDTAVISNVGKANSDVDGKAGLTSDDVTHMLGAIAKLHKM